ncbi:topoisomerase C-terminal repeat-containing protein, partial [Streptomyces sp. NPDC001215]
DGETNATLRSSDSVETITPERGFELLAEKRATTDNAPVRALRTSAVQGKTSHFLREDAGARAVAERRLHAAVAKAARRVDAALQRKVRHPKWYISAPLCQGAAYAGNSEQPGPSSPGRIRSSDTGGLR